MDASPYGRTRYPGPPRRVPVFVSVLFAIGSPLLLVAGGAGPSFTAVVVAVHDGDTISVRGSFGTARVRLAGIDCPEAGQPWSARAKRFTSALVFGRTVTVRSHGRDRYDRVLGRVSVGGTDVNVALVRQGFAWHYERGTPDESLAGAEREARAARAGLWADPDPVPPWRWRRSHPHERRR